ncbi:MAG: CotH kinase family protein [Lachnospiraceae bacterium]
MSTHKHFDRICCVVLAVTLVLTLLFVNADKFGVQKASQVMGYETRLFDTSKVHSIDILMDDWDEFIENCQSEDYYDCTVVIDNDACKNVAIRGKGNTSLSQVAASDSDRYSFKIEFDHYDSTNTYYGLDKLCLNNIIQDNTYMKDYLCYQMMDKMGVAAPLCSYVYITINGEDWGLYLAVEGVEDSFLQRNYGKDYGNLYKPDSQSMGGGRGNGEGFDMEDFQNMPRPDNGDSEEEIPTFPSMPENRDPSDGDAGDEKETGGNMPDGRPDKPGGGMKMDSDDVLLKYIDEEIESYSNIFDNAKTDVTSSDKKRLIQSLKNLSTGTDLEDTVDVEAVIRYFVVHNFVLNFDSYTGSMIHNYYLYEKDGQMQMIPWDYNLAFGGFLAAEDTTELVNYPIDSPVSGGDTQDRPMIAWIFENENDTQLYHQFMAEFLSEYFDSGYFEEMTDRVRTMISPYVEKDPTKFCTYEEFETGISTLKEFCLLRAQSIRGQLDGTIGSTSDTQESDTLIDAGTLNISDMGSMGMGGGRSGDGGGWHPGDDGGWPPGDGNGKQQSDNGDGSEQPNGGDGQQQSDDGGGWPPGDSQQQL